MSHNTLTHYYETSFALMQHHKYSISELENMMPWELEIYTGLLINFLKEEKERLDREQKSRR
tara:strand:+ start:774 stop:959 length:186 start_codon:yes stop_codon:yes gene_type:complete